MDKLFATIINKDKNYLKSIDIQNFLKSIDLKTKIY